MPAPFFSPVLVVPFLGLSVSFRAAFTSREYQDSEMLGVSLEAVEKTHLSAAAEGCCELCPIKVFGATCVGLRNMGRLLS